MPECKIDEMGPRPENCAALRKRLRRRRWYECQGCLIMCDDGEPDPKEAFNQMCPWRRGGENE